MKRLKGSSMHTTDTLDTGWLPPWEAHGVRFHHATQSGLQLKTYELLTTGIFHFIFSDHGWPQVMKP